MYIVLGTVLLNLVLGSVILFGMDSIEGIRSGRLLAIAVSSPQVIGKQAGLFIFSEGNFKESKIKLSSILKLEFAG